MKRFVSISILLFFHFNGNAKSYRVNELPAFETALQQVQAGDSIVWKNGVYTDLKLDFSPLANGTAKRMIYLLAETPGKVVLKGASQLLIGGDYLQAEGFSFQGAATLGAGEDVINFRSKKKGVASFCRVTNCAVIDYCPADAATNYDWLVLNGTHNEVDHCSFKGKTNQGPFMVVVYDKPKDFTDGSDACPSTYHLVHHNYFGYRTMPTDNGGECIRIGDSKTSMTKGFNVFEYNYFENEENEPEVISNKSCDNIYRYNVLSGNDGALVLRHGNRCLVYGNYINGKTGRGLSGGIRVIGTDHIVFNNYLENQEGGNRSLKSPISIMGGVPNSAINGYFAADHAVVVFNTIVNAVGPVIYAGAFAKTTTPIAPRHIVLVSNIIIDSQGKNAIPFKEEPGVGFDQCSGNQYIGGTAVSREGFTQANKQAFIQKGDYWYSNAGSNKAIVELIKTRIQSFPLTLADTAISVFDPKKMVSKKETGANWLSL